MNSKLLYKNIKALSKYKGVKIGDVEHSCGVQAGYISRLKRNSIQMVKLDVILAFSDALGVTVQSLVREELWKQIENEELKAEIRKLEKKLAELKKRSDKDAE